MPDPQNAAASASVAAPPPTPPQDTAALQQTDERPWYDRYAASFNRTLTGSENLQDLYHKAVDYVHSAPPTGTEGTRFAGVAKLGQTILDLAHGAFAGQKHETEAGLEQMRKPGFINKASGAVRYLQGGIPGVGPVLGQTQEQLQQGKYAEAAGTASTLLMPGAMEHAGKVDVSGLRTRVVQTAEEARNAVNQLNPSPSQSPEAGFASMRGKNARAPQSPFRIAAETPEKHAEFHEAVKNTEGAELHDKGLTLDVARQQKPEQAGQRAIRTGVFFLPEKKSPYQRYYTTGRQGYGGSHRIEGRTTFENPIIAKGAAGGKVPERAYDAINGKDAYDEMRQDVLDATVHGFGYGAKDPKVLTQRVADVLEKHGGNPELAADIVRTSKEGNQLAYAVQEHIVAASVRKAGHDAIIGYSKLKGQHRLSEVFDLRRDKYPISSQLFEASPTSPDLAGLHTREVSPATAVESSAKEVVPQHEAVGIHEDDVPRGSKTPDVDWISQDLQDSAKAVNEATIAKDYGPKRKGAKFSVYKSHIPMEDLPSAKIVEEEESDPELRNENWREDYQGILRTATPPIKVRVTPKGEMEILDGNHRARIWEDANMTHAPAWVIDERGKGIENLSEDERAERAEAEEEQRLYTPEGAQPLADKLGAKIVGSVAKKGASRDLDLRIEGDYQADEITSKMKEAGFEPRGSTVVSPKEAQASGKPYGKPGWKRAEHFENAAGHKVDIFHDEPEAAKKSEISKKAAKALGGTSASKRR